ncbi:hypothetical protein VTP01DRAFT_3053 [Rhizomucor pusillus]|uniref:uncharacterized protein n=1 Tax=Rhizomucor pusillus TaxID=4840 RepID=UPI0037436D0F
MVTIVLPAKPGKRYRPPSIDDDGSDEKRGEGSTSKFTKLKTGFALFSKFANSFSFNNNTENPWPNPTQQEQQGHKRRSSIGTFFQSLCNTRGESNDDALSKRRGSTNSFANDAIFERYRYRKQSLSQSKLDLGHKKQAPEDEQESDCVERNALTAPGCSAPLPRVICWQDPLPGILVNKSNNNSKNNTPGHRHTSSAVSVPTNVGHKRNKTIVHVRHYSHVSYISSSNITVNSEDLTAKEFADIAGIKILPEDESSSPKCSSCDEAMLFAESRRESTYSHADASSSGLSVNCGHNNNNNNNNNNSNNNNSSSSSSSSSSNSTPQIWDTAFWRDPVDSGIKQHPPSTSDTSILQTLRRESNEQINQQPTVIKRGRFEIRLGSP